MGPESHAVEMTEGDDADGRSVTVLASRLDAQLLSGSPARSAGAVAERLLAIQAQDPRGARLAIRARA